jgi:hypothetical protein
MLNTSLRKRIEWHFYNYKADFAIYEERVQDIVDSGLTSRLDAAGGRSSGHSSPTERKAMQIEALDRQKNWATVIRNTFDAFRFEPEYDIMVALYIKGVTRDSIIGDGLWERTFYRWRDGWLELACKWAKEFKLL